MPGMARTFGGGIALVVGLCALWGCQRQPQPAPSQWAPPNQWAPGHGWMPGAVPPTAGAPPEEPVGSPTTSALATLDVPPEPLVAKIELVTTGASAAGDTLDVVLRAPDGTQLWTCSRGGPFGDGRLDSWCALPVGWAASHGTYTVSATLARAGRRGEAVTQPFSVTGGELAIEVSVRIGAGDSAEVVVARVRPAPAHVRLERAFYKSWHPELPLRYTLVNGGTLPIEADGLKGHVLGSLEHKSGERWVAHGRGVGCDAVHGSASIAPGASAPALEGHFVGGLRPFIAGLYRYHLRFREVTGAVDAGLVELFEARDEIEIAKGSLRPSDPGADCDLPFSVDRFGTRRMKLECL